MENYDQSCSECQECKKLKDKIKEFEKRLIQLEKMVLYDLNYWINEKSI